MERLRGWWLESGSAARVGALVAAGVLIGVLAGAALVLGGGSGSAGGPPVVVQTARPTATASPAPTATATATATPAATATATATSTPSPTATATPDPTETPSPTPTPTPEPVSSIRELTENYGEPPDATAGRFRIPSLSVDAPLGTRFVGGDGQMPNPTGPSDVVWYDFSEWNGLGGAPGDGGNAIFSGHVDYAAYVAFAGVRYRGKGVFELLELLSPGDTVEVEMNGETFRYEVQWRRRVPAKDADWNDLLSADVERESLTLITCGGEFNYTTRSYVDRVVVRATRV